MPRASTRRTTRAEDIDSVHVVYSPDAMRNVMQEPGFADSCLPCNLELPASKDLDRIDTPLPATVLIS
jgi:hypothetical protein